MVYSLSIVLFSMQTRILNYRVMVKPDQYTGTDKPCYTAYCPALGVADGGDTVKEAMRNITGAIRAALTIDRKSKNLSVVVPKVNRILTKGTLHAILRQADISLDEFLKLVH